PAHTPHDHRHHRLGHLPLTHVPTTTDKQHRISGAHLRVQREYLGLTRSQLAEIWGMNPGTLALWEAGTDPTPYNLGERIDALLQTTNAHLDALARTHRAGDTCLTYRSDKDYRQHHPDGPYTASWHRALCGRLLAQIPGLTVEFR
ncbi:helix-turn-helix domain-containing protein, partial [Mycobacteroides abscessus]